MFQPASPLQVIWVLFVWLSIVIGVPLGCVLIHNCVSWVVSRRKKGQPQKLERIEMIRCFKCGALIDPDQQACQKCGWTWK